MTRILTTMAAAAFLATAAFATPSTLVWIPSTDIQGEKSFHFGYDDLINLGSTAKATSDSTLIGLTYGVTPNFEVGIDYLSGVSSPLFFNAKYGIGEPGPDGNWAFALGAYNFGTNSLTSPDILYGLAGYTYGEDRFHVGYFRGDSGVLTDQVSGARENHGLLLGWDRALGDRWWAAIDYQGSDSSFGAISPGIAYSVSDSAAVLIGANFFNNSAIANTLTIQFDIDFD